MEIQLHRYIEKAVLEYCYSNPAHQSWARKCCAPVYLTLTTMHLMFSFSFFLLFPPNLTLNHSNCILLEAVCVRSFQSLPHTHTPVWDWPREKSNENQRRGRVMDISFFAVLKTASRSCKTIISLLFPASPGRMHRVPAILLWGQSLGSTTRRAGPQCTLVCESNFMIPNSAPQKWCVKFLSRQSQPKPSRPAFMVLCVSKGRLNKFCLLFC